MIQQIFVIVEIWEISLLAHRYDYMISERMTNFFRNERRTFDNTI